MYRSVLTEVKTGQIVGLPVFNPQNWQMMPLVNNGAVITHTVLSRLLEFGVRYIWIQDEELTELDSMMTLDTQMVIREFTIKVAEFWNALKADMNRLTFQNSFLTERSLRAVTLQDMLKPIIAALRHDRYRVLAVQTLPRLRDPHIDRIVTRVLLSICLAIEMETQIFLDKIEKVRKFRRNLSLKDYQNAKDISSLALGALIYDFPDLANFKLPHDPEPSLDTIKMREQVISRELDMFSDTAARMIVRIRNQNYDGTGSPKSTYDLSDGTTETRGLRGNEIHLLGRMMRLVSIFTDYLLKKNSWLQALSRMQEEALNRVDPILVDTFLKMLPPFSLGSQVVLNNGALAIVVKENLQMPCRPVVHQVSPKPEASKVIDLNTIPVTSLFIETALDAPDVPCMDYFFSNISIPLN